jgi:hypothetical protein
MEVDEWAAHIKKVLNLEQTLDRKVLRSLGRQDHAAQNTTGTQGEEPAICSSSQE